MAKTSCTIHKLHPSQLCTTIDVGIICCWCSVAQSCPTLCNPMDCSTPRFPVFHYLPKFAQTQVCWLNNAIQPSHPLYPLLFPPSIFSRIKVFSKEWALCIRQPKIWRFNFSISPSNECSGSISFRIDWFDLLAVQETLRSLLQHHSLETLTLWHSASIMVQLSHLYKTTGKTIGLTIWTFIGKVMSAF